MSHRLLCSARPERSRWRALSRSGLVFLLILLVVAASGCNHASRGASKPEATPTPPPLPGAVRIEAGNATVLAELALTQEQKARGLMFREKLPEGRGMLFLFEREGTHGFWMKNVRFPIDMLWLDSGLRVVHREVAVPPCAAEPCPIYRPQTPARYVLEVPAGYTDAHGVRVGSAVKVLDPLPSPTSL